MQPWKALTSRLPITIHITMQIHFDAHGDDSPVYELGTREYVEEMDQKRKDARQLHQEAMTAYQLTLSGSGD